MADEVFDKPGSQKYARNFLPRRFEAVLTKYGKGKNAKAIFAHVNGENRSHYFRPLKYHGDKEVSQTCVVRSRSARRDRRTQRWHWASMLRPSRGWSCAWRL